MEVHSKNWLNFISFLLRTYLIKQTFDGIQTNPSQTPIPPKHPYTQTGDMYAIEKQIAGISTRGMWYTLMETITQTKPY